MELLTGFMQKTTQWQTRCLTIPPFGLDETYAKDVGIVIPRGESYYEALTTAAPPLNQSQVTISSEDIAPVQFSKQTGLSCSQTNRKDRKVFVLAKNSTIVLFAAGL